MDQVALYREWRPQVFHDVVGQEHVCRTLRNAVLMRRTAHAYLFCGPRGTGKTSTARILAKALNCSNPEEGEPCNNCPSCHSITKGISLNVIEMDAASHRGIEEIRDLKQKVGMTPSGGNYKVYIIDEVHMLTGEAFNALLKTLEEPPAHAVFILATTEVHKVPLTILSRCQRFEFRRLSRSAVKTHLSRVAEAKKWSVDDDALELISRQAGGALRDALGLLDQAASFTGGKIRRKDIELLTGALGQDELEAITASAAHGDVPAVLRQLDALFERGCDPRQVLLQLADHVRELIFHQNTGRKEQRFYARFLRGIALAEGEMKASSRPDLILELALLRLTGAVSPDDLQEEGRPERGRGKDETGLAVRGQAVIAAKRGGQIDKPSVGSTIDCGAAHDFNSDQKSEIDLAEIKNYLIKNTGKHPLLASVIPKCRLKREGDRLLLEAPSFYCDLIKPGKETFDFLKDKLREYGCSLSLELVPEGENSAAPQKSQENKSELLNLALTLFDARVIKQI